MTPPMFRVPAGAASSGRLTLDGAEGRHAADVKRLDVGEPIWLTDGAGTRWEGVVVEVRRGALDVDIEQVVEAAVQPPRLVAVQALAKGGRDEAAIESMTEIGVDEIVAWSASRSIAKWTDRTGAKWQSTIDAASKQARRSHWPSVSGPASSRDVAERLRAADVALVLHEAASARLADIEVADATDIVVVIGPEGGITDVEMDAFTSAGARAVRLGSTVLRSSTAGVAALSAICGRTRWA